MLLLTESGQWKSKEELIQTKCILLWSRLPLRRKAFTWHRRQTAWKSWWCSWNKAFALCNTAASAGERQFFLECKCNVKLPTYKYRIRCYYVTKLCLIMRRAPSWSNTFGSEVWDTLASKFKPTPQCLKYFECIYLFESLQRLSLRENAYEKWLQIQFRALRGWYFIFLNYSKYGVKTSLDGMTVP